MTRFWAALAFFHRVVASLAWWTARRQCARGEMASRAWLAGLVRDGLLLVVAMAAVGAVASTWAPTPGFTMLRRDGR